MIGSGIRADALIMAMAGYDLGVMDAESVEQFLVRHDWHPVLAEMAKDILIDRETTQTEAK